MRPGRVQAQIEDDFATWANARPRPQVRRAALANPLASNVSYSETTPTSTVYNAAAILNNG